MSWREKVAGQLTIKCGDGREYSPLYLNASKAVAYNLTQFNFPHINGTFVSRKSAQGQKYPVELYFQGANHLDVAQEFEISARDSRPWTVSHPYYGEIKVHPVALNFDNTEHNVSKVTGTLLETIEKVRPSNSLSMVDAIVEAKVEADEAIAAVYEAETPTASGLETFIGNVQAAYDQANRYAGQAGAEYNNAMRTARSAVSTTQSVLGAPAALLQTAIRTTADSIQFVQSFPADFVANIEDRYTALGSQLSRLTNLLEPGSMSNEEKGQYALQAGTIVTTMTTATVQKTIINAEGELETVPQEFASASEALSSVEFILTNYNNFVEAMDELQSENGGSPESFIPNMAAMTAIENSANLTVSNLFSIALNSQQERTLILEADSSAINLTHRFYGMDSEDLNLERFIQTNNLSLNQYLLIDQGTVVIYYV
tara:strand:- start:868 stop:2154 length:1287 start_codon:yes stop_codon:yes gene_type:complete